MAKTPVSSLRIAIAQSNLLVGDVPGNTERIIAVAEEARDQLRVDLVVFPELALTGYPPQDLLLRPDFIHAVESSLQHLCKEVRGIALVVGHPVTASQELYNAPSLIMDGAVAASYFKRVLPDYGLFDEQRYFRPGQHPGMVEFQRIRLGLTIGEDIEQPGIIAQSVQVGAQLMLNLHATPFHTSKRQPQREALRQGAKESGIPPRLKGLERVEEGYPAEISTALQETTRQLQRELEQKMAE
jgi:NAD+ synthase (glutamine-hydrolysing)